MLRDVRGERAEARGDRLLVADVGEDRPERREPAARLDRNQQTGLRHERQQAERLERDGLAARVRAGDDERPRRRHDDEIRGDRRRRAASRPSCLSVRSRTAGISSGCRAPRNSNRPSATSVGRDAVARVARARLWRTARRGRRPRRGCASSSSPRARKASVSAGRIRWISALLALDQRDDLVVQRDGRRAARGTGSRRWSSCRGRCPESRRDARRGRRARSGRCDR